MLPWNQNGALNGMARAMTDFASLRSWLAGQPRGRAALIEQCSAPPVPLLIRVLLAHELRDALVRQRSQFCFGLPRGA